MIFVKDADGNYILANRAVAERYRTTPSDLVGKSPSYFQEDSADLRMMLEADREVMTTWWTLFTPVESRYDASGNQRFFQTTRVPLSIPGDTRPESIPGPAMILISCHADISGARRIREQGK